MGRTLWAREEINATNRDIVRLQLVEDMMLGRNGEANAFASYIAEHKLDHRVFNSTPECNCLPGR